MPSINMNPSVRYVTQSSAYDQLLVGKKLTNRTITLLKKKGYFGSGIINNERKQNKKQTRKNSLSAFKQLMGL